jgi:hypothetical protein
MRENSVSSAALGPIRLNNYNKKLFRADQKAIDR